MLKAWYIGSYRANPLARNPPGSSKTGFRQVIIMKEFVWINRRKKNLAFGQVVKKNKAKTVLVYKKYTKTLNSWKGTSSLMVTTFKFKFYSQNCHADDYCATDILNLCLTNFLLYVSNSFKFNLIQKLINHSEYDALYEKVNLLHNQAYWRLCN